MIKLLILHCTTYNHIPKKTNPNHNSKLIFPQTILYKKSLGLYLPVYTTYKLTMLLQYQIIWIIPVCASYYLAILPNPYLYTDDIFNYSTCQFAFPSLFQDDTRPTPPKVMMSCLCANLGRWWPMKYLISPVFLATLERSKKYTSIS